MHIAKTVCLLLMLLAASIFIYTSFQPRVRFAEPATFIPGIHSNRRFSCYHDRIYLGNSNLEVLFFGSSRTNHAIKANQVINAYASVSDVWLDAFVFHTPWSNPEIVYFFFKDYLANNPAPEVAFFEVTPVGPLPRPVQYVHPLFTDLAPPYLYEEILTSSDLVRHKLFAVSDFLQLLVRHLDLSLSRFMVADFDFTVPAGENCRKGPDARALKADAARFDSFEQLLDTRLEKAWPDFAQEEIGRPDSVLKTYEGDAGLTKAAKGAIEKFGNDGAWPNKGHFWRRGAHAERSVDYYQRIAALGRAHNVKIGFYFLPDLLFPQIDNGQVEELAKTLNAPVYVLPFESVRVSYHHYRDPTHVSKEFTPVYSAWAASLIDSVKED